MFAIVELFERTEGGERGKQNEVVNVIKTHCSCVRRHNEMH
jgi:hypothetical protein